MRDDPPPVATALSSVATPKDPETAELLAAWARLTADQRRLVVLLVGEMAGQ